MVSGNIIKALKGSESLLLVLPKEVSAELNIANQDWLKFEIKNRQIVIKKIESNESYIKIGVTNDQSLKSYSYGKNVFGDVTSERMLE
jgi:bifunctional DNA-binding transcriptional regulator/antitoxin component of YhaV-PrlF toxin-antitoxin module